MMKIKSILIIGLLSFYLFGCSYVKFWEEKNIFTPTITLNILTNKILNPNINNESTPVELRIYQLKDNGVFTESNFLDLYNNDRSLLKEDITTSTKVVNVSPSNKKVLEFSLEPESQYIAVLAEFQDYQNAIGKLSYKVGSDLTSNSEIDLELNGNVMHWKNVKEVDAENAED